MLQTVLNALTFDTIRRRFKKSKELRGNRYSDAVKDYEKKMRILKKLLAMQAGFSLIAGTVFFASHKSVFCLDLQT